MSAATTGSVRISGPLVRAAECRVSPDSAAWLCLELPHGVRARWHLGTGAAAVLAGMQTARRLIKGTPVTVHADGLAIAPDRHIVMTGVHLVEHHAHITPHHQPAERELVATI